MAYSLAQAAKTVGRDRSTILRMIKLGRISAERDDASGSWRIEPSELHRLYPPKAAQAEAHAETHVDALPRIGESNGSTGGVHDPMGLWKLRIEADAARIADLTNRLDRAEDERKELQGERRELLAALNAAQTQVKLLTDQRPSAHDPDPEPPRTGWRRLLRALGHVR